MEPELRIHWTSDHIEAITMEDHRIQIMFALTGILSEGEAVDLFFGVLKKIIMVSIPPPVR